MTKNNAIVLLGGCAVTLLLFILLQALVRQTDDGLKANTSRAKIDFIRVQRDKENTRRTPAKPLRQTQKQTPPPRARTKLPVPPSPTPLTHLPLSRSLPEKLSLLHNFSAGVDGAALPLARVPPLYPARALQQGTEGWVLIEFSINKKGEVVAPRIIKAEPPFVFNRAALDAIVQWKYKPQVMDGEAQMQHKIQTRITFQLEQ